jgi:hypothetical protein
MEKPMQNQLPNEDLFARTLREMPTPPPPADLIERLQSCPKPRRPWLWALPATAATMISLALIPLFLAPPSLSLAQVARNQAQRDQYTIVNTRLLTSGDSFKITSYRGGNLWRRQSTYGLADQTVGIFRQAPYWNFVIFDHPRPAPQEEFRVDKLLRKGEEPKVERNILWKGVRAHRFTIHTTYRSGGEQPYDQEVIVDAATNLPLYMKIMRDKAQWGDEWVYDFSKPDPSVFKVKIPEDAKRFDHRLIRKQLEASVAPGPIGAILVDESRRLVLLVDSTNREPILPTWSLRASGIDGALTGNVSQMLLIRQVGQVVRNRGAITIGHRQWIPVSFFLPVDGWPKIAGIFPLQRSSGSLTTGKGKTEFKDVPVIRAGDLNGLLAPYAG